MVSDTIRCKNCTRDLNSYENKYCTDCIHIYKTISDVVISMKPVVLDNLKRKSIWETEYAFRVKVYKKTMCFDSYTDSYNSYEYDDVESQGLSWDSWMTHLPISIFNERDGDRIENTWPYCDKIVYEGNCYFIDVTHGEVVEKWRVGKNIYNYQYGS